MKILERKWFIAALCGVIFLIILSPYLIGGKLIRGDSGDGVIPYMSFLEQSFTKGESPFWNPFGAAGFPSFVSYSFPYNPVNLLLFILPALVVHHFGLWLVLAAALFFTILLVKEIGGSIVIGFIAGLSFLIAMLVYENNVYTAVAFAFQPFIFWIILKLIKAQRLSQNVFYIVLLAAVLAFVWLSAGSNYQFTVYTLVVAYIWMIYWARYFQKSWLTSAAKLTVGCALGTAIGLLGILPALIILGQFSLREGGFSFEYATSVAPIRWSDIALFVNPFFSGRSAETFLYMGMLPLLFFATSFLFKKIPHRKLFLLLFLVPLAIAAYKSPLLWVIQQLPGFSYFRHPSRFMIIGSFGAALLAGFGGERLLEWLKEKFKISYNKWLALVAIAIALIVLDYSIVWQKKFGPESVKAELLMESSVPQPLIEKIKERGAGRIFSVLPDDTQSVFYWSLANQPPPKDIDIQTMIDVASLYPNNQLIYGVETVELIESLPPYLGRYLSLIGARIWGGDYGEEKLNKYKGAEGTIADRLILLKQRSGLLDFLGIKYLLSGFDLSQAGFGYQYLGKVPIDTVKAGGYTFAFNIYENPRAKPLAYFSPIAAFLDKSETAYEAFKKNNFNGTFVECAACNQTIATADGKIELLARHNTVVDLATKAEGERFLVLSQNFMPGWRALVDERRADIFRVNAVFMGIFVPAGEHDVNFEFKYRDLLNPELVF